MVEHISMTVAKHKDSEESIHINSLINTGYQPQLKCICCGNDVIAKIGNGGKAKHFAHTSGTSPDIKAYQTNLTEIRDKKVHERAQEIISKLSQIKIPRLLDYKEIKKANQLKDLNGETHTRNFNDIVQQYIEFQIISAETEKIINNTIPDVYAIVEEIGNELKEKKLNLAIEVFKTHAVNKEKTEKYRQDQTYSVEINFSHISKYDIEDTDFNLDKQIRETLDDLKYYKIIYFPIDKTTQEYLDKVKNDNDIYITRINKKIIDEKEKSIIWAFDVEENKFILSEDAINKDYKCLCCNGILNIHDKHFKHKKLNGCEIFEQNKYSHYWYTQTLFLYRLMNKKNIIRTTNDFYLKFVKVKINNYNKTKERILVFESDKEEFEITACFQKSFINNNNYVDFKDFNLYKKNDLTNYPFDSKLILQGNKILNKIKQDKFKQEQKDKIENLREKENDVFSRDIYFLNDSNNLIKKIEIKSKYKCIFCKEELDNFKHQSTNKCSIFNNEEMKSLNHRYRYEINLHNINCIHNLNGYELNLSKTSLRLENRLNIKTKYQWYCNDNDINIDKLLPPLILNFKSFKKNKQNGIDLFFMINNKEFLFNLRATEKYSYNLKKENFIDMSFENFNKVFLLLHNKNYDDFLSVLYSHSKNKDFTEEFIKECSDFMNKEIGRQLDPKIIDAENEKIKNENQLISIKKQEEANRKANLENEWGKSDEKKENVYNYMDKYRKEKQESLKKEKQTLEKINTSKQNKENEIKKLISDFFNEASDNINYKIELDKNNKLKYFTAKNYIFINYYYEFKLGQDFPKEIIYLCNLARDNEYVELYKTHNEAIFFEENDLLLKKITLDKTKAIKTDLFISLKENKEEIKNLYQNKNTGLKPK